MAVAFPVDNSSFITLSIRDVVETLLIAVVLVVAVMFLFLQNWRATLIPTIAVPVVLLGTFGVLEVAGYSINVLTLFAMVLAIGLLVDDAIVVVENVQRIMEEEGLSPHDATVKSMEEITGALVGIGTVLAAVLLPMAFFSGSTGAIYRQFSVTIVAAVLLSVTVALILTPALCATLLHPVERKAAHVDAGATRIRPRRAGLLGRFFGWFNRTFDRNLERYGGALRRIISHPLPAAVVYIGLVLIMGLLFLRLPSGFLPDEDQGEIINLFTLPPGAVQARSDAVARQIEQHYLTAEKDNVEGIFSATELQLRRIRREHRHVVRQATGLEVSGRRKGPCVRHRRVARWLPFRIFLKVKSSPAIPPAVRDLGTASGFDLELEDLGGLGHDRMMQAQYHLLGMAAPRPAAHGGAPQRPGRHPADRTRRRSEAEPPPSVSRSPT